jgi:hypothetical protein
LPIGDQGKFSEIFRFVRRFQNSADFIRADKRVNFRQFLQKIVAVTLDQTTGDDDALRYAVRFRAGRFENRFDRFGFRRFDKTASVSQRRFPLPRCYS